MKTFVGIGFGPIQSGLFLLEAYKSRNFDRLVVAEVAADVVGAVRRSGGSYTVNVAGVDATRTEVVEGLEVYNPNEPADREPLTSAIASADEIATALPSVEFYLRGSPSPGGLLAEGLGRRFEKSDPCPVIVYAAENHNHAAESLRDEVRNHMPSEQRDALDTHVQFLNTVIGKMSGTVDGLDQLEHQGLKPLVDSGHKAVLVEEFNRILIETVTLPGVSRGLDVFEEKPDLLPFEEAKLFGHNAAHALMGYLAHLLGMQYMSETHGRDLLDLVEGAFLVESGQPLCRRHAGVDPLFTEAGWEAYVRDLLRRMTNPFLQDRVDRVIRDSRRKLGWDDRFIGTMRLALEYDVRPENYALGAAAAAELALRESAADSIELLLEQLWCGVQAEPELRVALLDAIHEAQDRLQSIPALKPDPRIAWQRSDNARPDAPTGDAPRRNDRCNVNQRHG